MSGELLPFINTFKEPLFKGLKGLGDEIKYFFDDGLLPYLDIIHNKFLYIKTFLFRRDNIYFYDTYFQISLKSSKGNLIKTESIQCIIGKFNYITILGNAGSGKSMIMKFIFLETIKNSFKIPLIIELRNLNEFNGPIKDFLCQNIFENRLSPNNKILERILSDGNFLFLLDGYDEIFSENKQKITKDLDSFIDRYSNNIFIITSRPGTNIENLPRFEIYEVMPLNNDETISFIKLQSKIFKDKEFAKRIIEAINKNENLDYYSYLSSPLLLSMFILTFDSYPILPNTKNKFYWNVFETLFTKHDSVTKMGGFQHERKSGLSMEDFEKILKWFSYKSLFEGKYYFDSQYLNQNIITIMDKLGIKCNVSNIIDDLIVSIGILIIDGLEYKFPHKSLQEYFAALLIKDQTDADKIKIYDKKFEIFNRMTFGGYENFWNLCIEIDKICFYKNFILKSLDLFFNAIQSENHLETLKNLLVYLNVKYMFLFETKIFHLNLCGYSGNLITDILNFLNIDFNKFISNNAQKLFDYNRINILELLSKDRFFIVRIDIDNFGIDNFDIDNIDIDNIDIDNSMNIYKYTLSFNQEWDDIFMNFLNKSHYIDNINSLYNSIVNIYTKLDEEINKEERNNIELLDF